MEQRGGGKTTLKKPGVRRVSQGSEEERQMEETGCEIICGAQTTLVVKELMMMMMMLMMMMISTILIFVAAASASLYGYKPQQQALTRSPLCLSSA